MRKDAFYLNTFASLMASIKSIIPHAITSANLFCGCLALTQVAEGHFVSAALFVLLGAFFDFFDGLAARALKVGSQLGAELDSLADMVTFGIVPAYLAFEWLNEFDYTVFNYLAFIIAVFSAIRLAKFNIDTRQSESFIGLPTPSNALFWISLPLIKWQISSDFYLFKVDFIMPLLENTILLYIAIVLLSYLLIAELPLLALKFKSLKWQENKYRFILLLGSLILIALFLFAAIPFILLLYVILSIIQTSYK